MKLNHVANIRFQRGGGLDHLLLLKRNPGDNVLNGVAEHQITSQGFVSGNLGALNEILLHGGVTTVENNRIVDNTTQFLSVSSSH